MDSTGLANIQPLSSESRRLIEAGLAVGRGFAEVSTRLCMQSLEMDCSSLAVRFDPIKGYFCVIDNGNGRLHEAWSKCGDFFHSLACLSKKVSILVRQRGDDSKTTRLIEIKHHDTLITKVVEEPRRCCGMTVTINGIFDRLPVRRHKLNSVEELRSLVADMTWLSLIWSRVSITLRNEASGKVLLQTHRTGCIQETFQGLFGAVYPHKLVEMKLNSTADDAMLSIVIWLGTRKHSNSSLQFVFVNGKPTVDENCKLRRSINDILRKSLLDQHPMYIAVIGCSEMDTDVINSNRLVYLKGMNILKDMLYDQFVPMLKSNGLLKSNVAFDRPKDDIVIKRSRAADTGDDKLSTDDQDQLSLVERCNRAISDHVMERCVRSQVIGFDILLAKLGSTIKEPCLESTAVPEFTVDKMDTMCFEYPSNDIFGTTENLQFCKAWLPCARVIGQVDRKFIACVLDTSQLATNSNSDSANKNSPSTPLRLLMVIDQHAADERVQLEHLLSKLPSCGHRLDPPVYVELNAEESLMIGFHKQRLQEKLSISLIVMQKKEGNSSKMVAAVETVPSFIERHAVDQLLHGCLNVEEASSSFPRVLRDAISSHACRSAIKFNDALSVEQCQTIVDQLAVTNCPFQCAHGRPTMIPLLNLNAL